MTESAGLPQCAALLCPKHAKRLHYMSPLQLWSPVSSCISPVAVVTVYSRSSGLSLQNKQCSKPQRSARCEIGVIYVCAICMVAHVSTTCNISRYTYGAHYMAQCSISMHCVTPSLRTQQSIAAWQILSIVHQSTAWHDIAKRRVKHVVELNVYKAAIQTRHIRPGCHRRKA